MIREGLLPVCIVVGCSAVFSSCNSGPQGETNEASDGAGQDGTSSTGLASEDTGDACPELVHEGDISITPETDFSALELFTEVRGDVNVARLEFVSDLSVLRCLERIDGRLILWNNSSLRSLYGLSRLQYVEGLSVDSNRLESLSGLDSLAHVSVLSIRSSPFLTSLSLDSLETVDTLEIGYCQGGGANSDGILEGWGNMSLRGLEVLGALRSVGRLRIEWNESLESLGGLHAIADNGGAVGEIIVRHNDSLPASDVQATVSLLEAEGVVCGNLGDKDSTLCACDPSPP